MSRTGSVNAIIFITLLTIISITAGFAADGGIQVMRPLDGSTVRETVNILIPVSSVPDGGFVGCTIDGHFRAAVITKSIDENNFVYRWNTKDTYTSPTTLAKIPPRDGEHKISVQAFGSDGKKVGEPKEITVYVSNNASKLMPSSGLKLRYRQKLGQVNNFRFKYTIDIKKIQGGSSIGATVGSGVEGASGIVKRSIEDIMPDGSALVRHKLIGPIMIYQGGNIVQNNIDARSVYDTEDTLGRVTYVLKPMSQKTGVSIDLPNLPYEKVKVGYSWTNREKVFRDAITGKSTALDATSVVEGLEWERGYPCIKIRTNFSARMPIPFSKYFTSDVDVYEGYQLTYFAFDSGKLISSVTHAKARATVPQSVVNELTKNILPSGLVYNPTGSMGSETPADAIGGPPGMEEDYPRSGARSRVGAGSEESQFVDVEMEINQILEPAATY